MITVKADNSATVPNLIRFRAMVQLSSLSQAFKSACLAVHSKQYRIPQFKESAAAAVLEHCRKLIHQQASRLCVILPLRLIPRLCCAASGEQLI